MLARPGPWGPSGQTLNLRAHEVPLQRLPSALTGAVFAPSPASGRSRSPTGTWSRSSPTPSTPAPRPWTVCTASPGPPRCPRPSGPALCAGARGPAAGCVFWFPQGLTGSGVLDMVNNFRALRSETELLLAGRVALVSWARAPAVGGRVQRAGRSGPDSSRPQEARPVVGGALGHVVTVSPAALRSPVDTNASVAVDGPVDIAVGCRGLWPCSQVSLPA